MNESRDINESRAACRNCNGDAAGAERRVSTETEADSAQFGQLPRP